MGERVLVTGGAGYLGSVVVHELLKNGRSVRVLDGLIHGSVPSLLLAWAEGEFEFVPGDIRDPSTRLCALDGVSAIVHLAGIVGDPACSRQPGLTREVNLEATKALVADATAAGVSRFVFASTCSNYGRIADGDAYATEEWELRPVSLYAETKVAAERHILEHAADDLTACCLRLATLYGASPRMRFDLTVNEFARDLAAGRELVVFGEQFWRPYVHVRDAAQVLTRVLDAPREKVNREVFNVGSTAENYRKSDLVELLRKRIPEADVKFVQKVEDPRDYRVSFKKLEDVFGVPINRTVPDGMDEVIALVRSGLISDPFSDVYRN